jgi:hypothetical protein
MVFDGVTFTRANFPVLTLTTTGAGVGRFFEIIRPNTRFWRPVDFWNDVLNLFRESFQSQAEIDVWESWLSYFENNNAIAIPITQNNNNIGNANLRNALLNAPANFHQFAYWYRHTGDKSEQNFYMNDHLRSIYKPDLCWLSLIIGLFHTPRHIERRQTKLVKATQSYANFLKFLGLNICVEEAQQHGLRFTDIKRFFEYFRIRLTVLDPWENIMHTVRPENVNKDLRPSHVFVVYHNRHVTLLSKTDELEKTCRKLRLYENIESPTTTPINYIPYKVSEYAPTSFQYNANDCDEIMEILKNHQGDTDEPIKIFCSNDLEAVLRGIVFRMGIIPNTKFTYASGISKISTKNFVIQNYGSACVGNLQYSGSEMNPVNVMVETVAKFKTEMRNPRYRSRFDREVIEFLIKTRPSSLFHGFGKALSLKNSKETQWDMRKCFPSILLKYLEYTPVYSLFDRFEPYDGHAIHPYNTYIIEYRGDPTKSFLKKRFCRVFGLNLLHVDPLDYTVTSYMKPTHLESNALLHRVLTEFYQNEKLQEIEKDCPGVFKDGPNTLIGLLGRHTSRNQKSVVYTEKVEAYAQKAQYGGLVIEIEDCFEEAEHPPIYLHTYEKDLFRFNENYIMIHDLIVETTARVMMEIVRDLREFGLDVLGVICDCVITRTDPQREIEFQNSFKDKWFSPLPVVDGGYLKNPQQTEKSYNYHRSKIYENEIPDPTNLSPLTVPVHIQVEDEYDTEAILETISKQNTALSGDYPGVGKSFTAQRLTQMCPDGTLWIVPTTELVQRHLAEGHSVVTVETFLGVSVDDDGTESDRRKNRNHSEYTHIIVDEASMVTIINLERIHTYMQDHPEQIFLVIYDMNQIQPNHERLNNVSYKQYKENVIRQMCGRYIVLQKIKRANAERDVNMFTKFSQTNMNASRIIEFLRKNCPTVSNVNQITTRVSIAYRNTVCQGIANHVHSAIVGRQIGDYRVGDVIIYRGKARHIGKGDKKITVYKNNRYDIVDVTEKHIHVQRRFSTDRPIRFAKSFAKNSFMYEYAYTGHQIQGATISEPVTIDLSDTHMICSNPEWINSVVFRATRWDDIHILYDPKRAEKEKQKLLNEFAILTTGYLNSDQVANRVIRKDDVYITPEWMYSKIIENGQCELCHEPLDFDYYNTDHNISADRIYNRIGHTESNCRIACRHCNISKRE